MGNRAIYNLMEDSALSHFSTHYGANALSPLLRLAEAKAIQQQLSEPRTIAHIFEHLDYDGAYQEKRLDDADMFFWRIPPQEVAGWQESYASKSLLEMQITLDLDKNCCTLEYNPNCPWYQTMGSFSIDLDAGLENVKKLLEHGERHGITDFGRLLAIYHNSTGLAEKLESARGFQELSEYVDSPEAEEQRRRYRELIDRQAEPDGENEEMEER